jgi:Uma2 family endonuclease
MPESEEKLMASVSTEVDYPSSDGKPGAETPIHRENLLQMIEMLRTWYADNDQVYISGNMFVYHEQGNRRRHVSPDVMVVKGISRRPERKCYLVWKEGEAPDLVVEMTSRSTCNEDLKRKFALYRDILQVKEYFLFDPYGDYLDSPLQGHRLRGSEYHPIKFVNGRLPSKVSDLHFEADGETLRVYDPETQLWIPTPREQAEQEAEAHHREAKARQEAETGVVRLPHELEVRRRGLHGKNGGRMQ